MLGHDDHIWKVLSQKYSMHQQLFSALNVFFVLTYATYGLTVFQVRIYALPKLPAPGWQIW